jgi:hypothetical protein
MPQRRMGEVQNMLVTKNPLRIFPIPRLRGWQIIWLSCIVLSGIRLPVPCVDGAQFGLRGQYL